jgi:hypothetical protein
MARLEELGFEWDDSFDEREGQTLVTFVGEARAPDPATVDQAHRDLIAALDEIDRTLADPGSPAATAIDHAGQRARRAREDYADALNTTARPASRPGDQPCSTLGSTS